MRLQLTPEMQSRSIAFCEWLEANFPIDPMDAGFITLKAQEAFVLVGKKQPQASGIITIRKVRRTAL